VKAIVAWSPMPRTVRQPSSGCISIANSRSSSSGSPSVWATRLIV
jgi:hypothetical protein